ncbi:MAG: LacI family DNA-binding transcriptional regulator [Gorillibacterium sp.]|nr:LacI family DNA-binding transcriptional regulator [Gorillibacterium sp.]
MKKVTLQTIATKLNVSKALVSKALANDPAVNDGTRETIWKTADMLGYRVKASKKNSTSLWIGNLVVMMPQAYLNDFEYWGAVIRGVHNELTQHGYNMILSGVDLTNLQRDGLPPIIEEGKVDGVIALGHLPEFYIALLKAKTLPLVKIDANFFDTEVDHVLSNNFSGAYQATSYLLQSGHRHLAFVGDVNSAYSFSERKRGFEQAALDFQAAGEGEVSTVMIPGMGVSGMGNYTSPQFPIYLKEYIEAKPSVTAMFCANDLVAIEVLAHLSEWGVDCPADVSVVGFDDLIVAEHTKPKLTTVRVPRMEIGQKAVQLILRRIEHPHGIPELVLLPTTFVERVSVRSIRQDGKAEELNSPLDHK